MPIRRAGLYGGLLGGAGDTLQLLAATRIKRREREQDQAEQRAWEMQKLQMNALAGISEKIATDPTKARALIQAASSNPFLANLRPVIEGMRPSDPTIAAELQRQIGTVKSAADLPDVSRVAAAAGINTTQMPPTMLVPPSEPLDVRPDEMPAPPPQVGLTREMGQAPYAPPITPNIAPAETLLPELKARFAHNNPVIEDLQRGATEQGTQLRQGQEDALTLKTREKTGEAYGTRMGTDLAAHEGAPIAAEDQRQLEDVLRAGKVQTANAIAGGDETARDAAKYTPENIKGAAAYESALATARNNADIAKQQRMIKENILDPQRQAAALQLSDNFRQETAPFRTKELSFRTILAAANPELQKSPTDLSAAASLSIIFAYMKLLDPLSAVQKGEQASAENARGVPEDVRALYNAITGGAKLTQNQIRDFTHQAFNQYQGAKDMQTRAVQHYTQQAALLHVDPLLVVSQPDPALDTDITGAAPGSALDAILKR